MFVNLKEIRLNEKLSSIAINEQRVKSIFKTWIQQQAEKPVNRLKRSWVSKPAAGIKRWLMLESLIALVLLLFPLLLIAIDGLPIKDRESISAYYLMGDPKNLWAFYFPLTIAAFMFIVNGVIKHESWYNIFLGVMLAGVILFNHTDFKVIHPVFAIPFFIGNFIVVFFVKTGVFNKPVTELLFDLGLCFTAALFLILFCFKIIYLFYLEWASFAMITIHFSLVSYKKMKGINSYRTKRVHAAT